VGIIHSLIGELAIEVEFFHFSRINVFDLVANEADGYSISPITVGNKLDPREEYDTSIDDVELGFNLAMMCKGGQKVYRSTVPDEHGRNYNFFFVAKNEGEIANRLRHAFKNLYAESAPYDKIRKI